MYSTLNVIVDSDVFSGIKCGKLKQIHLNNFTIIF